MILCKDTNIWLIPKILGVLDKCHEKTLEKNFYHPTISFEYYKG